MNDKCVKKGRLRAEYVSVDSFLFFSQGLRIRRRESKVALKIIRKRNFPKFPLNRLFTSLWGLFSPHTHFQYDFKTMGNRVCHDVSLNPFFC